MKYLVIAFILLLPINSFAKKQSDSPKNYRSMVTKCIDNFEKFNDKQKFECLKCAVIVIDAYAMEAYYNSIDLNNKINLGL
jgi:hypothetical protein